MEIYDIVMLVVLIGAAPVWRDQGFCMATRFDRLHSDQLLCGLSVSGAIQPVDSRRTALESIFGNVDSVCWDRFDYLGLVPHG